MVGSGLTYSKNYRTLESTSERFETWINISRNFRRIEKWKGQKFKAQKLLLFGARMRFSRLNLNMIKNDFYGQYLPLSDHHWTKFWQIISSRVQIWEIILHFSIRKWLSDVFQNRNFQNYIWIQQIYLSHQSHAIIQKLNTSLIRQIVELQFEL